jgi:hypothetical protein
MKYHPCPDCGEPVTINEYHLCKSKIHGSSVYPTDGIHITNAPRGVYTGNLSVATIPPFTEPPSIDDFQEKIIKKLEKKIEALQERNEIIKKKYDVEYEIKNKERKKYLKKVKVLQKKYDAIRIKYLSYPVSDDSATFDNLLNDIVLEIDGLYKIINKLTE